MTPDEYINQPVAKAFLQQAKSQGMSAEEALGHINDAYQQEFGGKAQQQQPSAKQKALALLENQKARQAQKTAQMQAEHPLLASLFPSYMKSAVEDKGYGEQAGSAFRDIATSPFRIYETAVNPEYNPLTTNVDVPKNAGLIHRGLGAINQAIAKQGPELATLPFLPEAKISSSLAKMAPRTAQTAGKLLDVAATGAYQGGILGSSDGLEGVYEGAKSGAVLNPLVYGAAPALLAAAKGALTPTKAIYKYLASKASGASPEALEKYGMGKGLGAKQIQEAAGNDLEYGLKFNDAIAQLEHGGEYGQKGKQIKEAVAQMPPISTAPGADVLESRMPKKYPGYGYIGSGPTGTNIEGFDEKLANMLGKTRSAYITKEMKTDYAGVHKNLDDSYYSQLEDLDKNRAEIAKNTSEKHSELKSNYDEKLSQIDSDLKYYQHHKSNALKDVDVEYGDKVSQKNAEIESIKKQIEDAQNRISYEQGSSKPLAKSIDDLKVKINSLEQEKKALDKKYSSDRNKVSSLYDDKIENLLSNQKKHLSEYDKNAKQINTHHEDALSQIESKKNNLQKDYIYKKRQITDEEAQGPLQIESYGHEMPAQRVLDYRRDVDKGIPWGKPELQPYEQQLSGAYKDFRHTLKNQLIESAKQAGVYDKYGSAIDSWSKDLELIDNMRNAPGGFLLNSNPQAFINQLHNPAKKQLREAVKAIAESNPDMPMADVLEKALNVKLASSLGMDAENLKPSWGPSYRNGALAKMWDAVSKLSASGITMASPRMASYVVGGMSEGQKALGKIQDMYLRNADKMRLYNAGVPLSELVRKKDNK